MPARSRLPPLSMRAGTRQPVPPSSDPVRSGSGSGLEPARAARAIHEAPRATPACGRLAADPDPVPVPEERKLPEATGVLRTPLAVKRSRLPVNPAPVLWWPSCTSNSSRSIGASISAIHARRGSQVRIDAASGAVSFRGTRAGASPVMACLIGRRYRLCADGNAGTESTTQVTAFNQVNGRAYASRRDVAVPRLRRGALRLQNLVTSPEDAPPGRLYNADTSTKRHQRCSPAHF